MASTNLNKNRLVIPGDYSIDELSIVTYTGNEIDLRPQLVEIIIEENIYNNCITGQIILAENVNLIKYLPIIGSEQLKITFKTPSRDPVSAVFSIYKIENKIDLNKAGKQNIIILAFVSSEFIKSEKIKISKAFNNIKISDIAANIYTDYIKINKKIYIEDTLNTKSYVLPYKHPISHLNWLSKKSISISNLDTNYIFFENLSGFFFCSLNFYANNISKNSVKTYYFYQGNVSTGSDIRNLEEEFFRVEDYTILTMNDTLKGLNSGVFSSKLITHDVTYKKIEETEFNYFPDYYNLNKINKNGIIPLIVVKEYNNNSYSNYSYCPKHSYQYNDIENNDEIEKTLLKRKAHMSHYDFYQIELIVAGDSDRRVGEQIQFNVFSTEPFSNKSSENKYDPYISGKYLITKITHFIQKGQYKMKMKIERDSMNTPYPETVKINNIV